MLSSVLTTLSSVNSSILKINPVTRKIFGFDLKVILNVKKRPMNKTATNEVNVTFLLLL